MVISRTRWLSEFAMLLALAAASASCNAVLGIDAAELDDSPTTPGQDASVEAAADAAAPEASGPSVCEKSGEACWDCTAGKCCDEYATCQGDPGCAQTLAGYNDCLKSPPDGGESCAEQFAGKNARFLTLSNCTLLDKCFGACANYPLGNLCGPYCACMAENCADKTFAGGSCAQSCPSLNAEQVQCRSLHCTFAKGDPLHCDHAVGEDICP